MMTTETVRTGRRSELEIDELLWELELLDSDWVDAEFMGIMLASGLGDRVLVAADALLGKSLAPVAARELSTRRDRRRRKLSSRVRSPPTGL